MNATCGVAIVLFALRERQRFFDYRLFMLVPETDEATESGYDRLLNFLV